jgi:hypothetical protein
LIFFDIEAKGRNNGVATGLMYAKISAVAPGQWQDIYRRRVSAFPVFIYAFDDPD